MASTSSLGGLHSMTPRRGGPGRAAASPLPLAIWSGVNSPPSGMPGALVLQAHEAVDANVAGLAGGIEEVGECSVIGGFGRCNLDAVRNAALGEVLFERVRQHEGGSYTGTRARANVGRVRNVEALPLTRLEDSPTSPPERGRGGEKCRGETPRPTPPGSRVAAVPASGSLR